MSEHTRWADVEIITEEDLCFSMTNIAAAPTFQYPDAIVNYASVVTLEVRENMAGNGHDGESCFYCHIVTEVRLIIWGVCVLISPIPIQKWIQRGQYWSSN